METGISYFGSRLAEHVFPDLEKIRESGCTYVVHTFSEEDVNFYARNMSDIIAKTKSLGMKAHVDPWGVAGIFGGETFSYYVAKNLHVRQITNVGKSEPLACLNHPELISFMKKWIDKAVEIGADSIFWDEPHFYVPGWFGTKEPMDVWGCRCDICKNLYKQKYHQEMPHEETDQVKHFKHDCLIDFLTEMCDYTAKQGVENTVCMLPNEDIRDSGFWRTVGQTPHLSSFGTDPYWITKKKIEPNFDMDKYMRPFCKEVQKVAAENNLRGHIWIQNFHIPEGWESDIIQAIDIAVSEGIQDITAWCFYGAKGMSTLCSDRPEKVWNTLKKSYLKIQNNNLNRI